MILSIAEFICNFVISFNQSLRLSALSASTTGSGYLVNLMSNDVGRLDRGFLFVHYIWILPLQVSHYFILFSIVTDFLQTMRLSFFSPC